MFEIIIFIYTFLVLPLIFIAGIKYQKGQRVQTAKDVEDLARSISYSLHVAYALDFSEYVKFSTRHSLIRVSVPKGKIDHVAQNIQTLLYNSLMATKKPVGPKQHIEGNLFAYYTHSGELLMEYDVEYAYQYFDHKFEIARQVASIIFFIYEDNYESYNQTGKIFSFMPPHPDSICPTYDLQFLQSPAGQSAGRRHV